jgi:L-alanine-DL-glutamate epimerase-like enolase superfamily enzyme
MTRKLNVRTETWPLRQPFAISRGVKVAAEVVVAEIDDGGVTGRGEAVPYARYGEDVPSVMAAITAQAVPVASGLDRAGLAKAMPAGAARNALDCALWDLAAKQAGRRAWELAGLSAPRPVITAQTISLDSPQAMADAAAGMADQPLLKIKVGSDGVFERVQAVRLAAPRAGLIVDANEGWDLLTLRALLPELARLGVEVIEQPLPAGRDGELARLAPAVTLCADESCHTAADLDRLPAAFGMVNIKLDKAGGLTAALQLARTAQDRGLKVMVGCMVATSLAIAPALLLSAFADVVDLDGPLWLQGDRTPPLPFSEGAIGAPPAQLWG